MLCTPARNVSQRDGKRPTRTCVACGHKKVPSALARVIRAPSGEIVVDWRRNLAGRGAHVCPTRKCVEGALGKRLFNRAFKGKVKYPATQDLLDTMRRALLRQIETLIRSGAAGHLIGIGETAVAQALKTGTARCLVLAEDAANTEGLMEAAARAGVPVNVFENKVRLGEIAGRAAVGKMAVLNDRLAEGLTDAFGRLKKLD